MKVELRIVADGRSAILERHDIVYRNMPAPDKPGPGHAVALNDDGRSRRIAPDEVMLFRYSALTFNGRRIHNDRAYATGVEHHPGLMVHGPLIAKLLLDLLRRE